MSGEHFAALPAVLPKAADVFKSVEFLVTVGVLSVVLLGGAVVLYFTDIWRKRQFEAGRDSTESLTSFRALYERGELTESEYQKIRDKMAAQMKREVGLTPLPPPAAPDPASGANPADGAADPPTAPPSG